MDVDLNSKIIDNTDENEEEKTYINTKDKDFIKYISIPSKIKAKHNIELSIIIPESVNKNEEEWHKIKRKLILSTNDNIQCEIDIEIYIQTIPIGLFISCEKYKIKYLNGKYFLDSKKFLSKEEIEIKIKSYYEDEQFNIKTRIQSLDKNTCDKPSFGFKDDKCIIKIPKADASKDIMRLNCILEIYLFSDYYIPIQIDAAIIPIDFDLVFFDFISKQYKKNDKMEIILPEDFNKLEIEVISNFSF